MNFEKLSAARDAMQNFNPELALKLLEEFQHARGGKKASEEEIEIVTREINDIRVRASAALAGISSALAFVREMASIGRGFDCYDKSGSRHGVHEVSRKISKF